MYQKCEDIVLRPIHGSYFLINIADNYSGDQCNLFEINETGAFLWKHIDTSCTKETLVRELQNVLIDDVPQEVLLNDISEFLGDLAERGFVSEVEDHG